MNSKKHPLRFAMAMERNLITVPCENEDRPEKEDAVDFDEDTLQGTQSLSQLTFRYQFHLNFRPDFLWLKYEIGNYRSLSVIRRTVF